MSPTDTTRTRAPLLVALDLGASKTCALAGLPRGDQIEIVGHGLAPAPGLRAGVVVDLEAAAQCVGQAVAAACQGAGRAAGSVWLGVTGPHLECAHSQGQVHVAGGEVSQAHANRALEAASQMDSPRGRELLHVVPRWFEVDGVDRVSRPVGLTATRLAAHVALITAPSNALDNTEKAVEAAGLKVEEMVMGPIATAEAALSQQHRQMGVVLLDIGAASTDFALFVGGALARCGSVPVAGDHLTRDIAAGLRVPLDAAQELKQAHGHALPDRVGAREMVTIPGVPLRARRPVPKRLIASILEARLREIFRLVGEAMGESHWQLQAPGGAVLTGGTSRLPGIVALAGDALGCPVTPAPCLGTIGPPEVVRDPARAACVGLLHYAARRRRSRPRPPVPEQGLWRRVIELARRVASRLLRRP